jgi:hypothetical protein
MLFALGLLYLLIKIEVSIMPNSLIDNPVYSDLARNLGKVYRGDNGHPSVFVGNVDEFIESVGYMQRGEPCGRPVLPDLRAVVTQCNDQHPGALPPKYTVQTLIPYLQNFSKLEYLNISNCGITDTGVTQLANNLGALGVKTLVLANNHYVTQAGRDAIKQSLSQVPHEVFVSWANKDGTGTATFKDKSNKTYDMVIKSDGADAIIDFADNNTGISGVSAGDTCPPSVREQMAYCLGAGTGTMMARWENCSKLPGQAKLVCLGGAFLTGCAAGVATKSITECARGEEYHDHDGRDDRGDSYDNTGNDWDINVECIGDS